MIKNIISATALYLLTLSAVHATTISFDSYSPGEIVTNQTISGATLSVDNQGTVNGVPRELMIFDATCGGIQMDCTGGDSDLFFPQYGNVLIISEDNDSSDPDDNAGSGDIFFDFATAISQISVDVLDVENGGPMDNWVAAFLGGNEIARIFVTSGDNEFTSAIFGDLIADQLQVHFAGSGAVGELNFAPVPIPAALPMFVAGLLGLFGFRKIY